MLTLCAYQFEIEPLAGQTGRQCVVAVWERLAAWVQEKYRGAVNQVPDMMRTGYREVQPLGHHLRLTQQPDGTHNLITFDWQVPADGHPAFIWHLNATLACADQAIEAALVFQLEPRKFCLSKQMFDVFLDNQTLYPMLFKVRGFFGGFLPQLVRGLPCRIGGQAVPTYVSTITAKGVELFVQNSLLHPQRVLPVLMYALDNSTSNNHTRAIPLQEMLLGLAEVVMLKDQAAVESLHRLLGPERSCEDGVRIYWPGFTRDSPPEDHPFQTWSELRELESLTEYFYAKLALLSAGVFREGPVIRKVRDRISLLPAAQSQPQAAPIGDATFTPNEPGQRTVLRAALEQTNRDRNAALLQTQEAQRERDAARTKLAEVREERNVVQAKLQKAEREREEAKRERNEAKRPLQEAQRQRHAAEAERQRATARLAGVETELKEVRQERERFRKEWDTARQRAITLEKELADHQAQLTAAREAMVSEKRQNEFYAELESALDENDRLRGEGEAARQRIVELEADLRNTKNNLAQLWMPPAAGGNVAPPPALEPGERQFTSVADALRAAAVEFADVLAVWEDAIRSAEASLFTSPAKVFQALRAIAEVGRAFFQARDGGTPLGPIGEAFRNRVPFKYTGFESQTTLGHFGAERVFHHREQSRQMQRHLTLGGGQTSNCLQIYFEFDDASRRVLVGHCGRHLPFARQRT